MQNRQSGDTLNNTGHKTQNEGKQNKNTTHNHKQLKTHSIRDNMISSYTV